MSDIYNYRFCSACGDAVNLLDARWRFTGDSWEHKCSDPQAGYFAAVPKYVGIKITGFNGYIVPMEELSAAIENELKEMSDSDALTITPKNITPEEFASLEEFSGY